MRYNRSYSLASMYPLISPRKPPKAPFKEFEPSRSEQAEDMWRNLCHGRPCDKELRNAQVHPRKRRRQITAKPVSLAVLAKLSWIGIFGNKPAPGTSSWNIALTHAGIETCTPRYMKCAKRDYFLFYLFKLSSSTWVYHLAFFILWLWGFLHPFFAFPPSWAWCLRC